MSEIWSLASKSKLSQFDAEGGDDSLTMASLTGLPSGFDLDHHIISRQFDACEKSQIHKTITMANQAVADSHLLRERKALQCSALLSLWSHTWSPRGSGRAVRVLCDVIQSLFIQKSFFCQVPQCASSSKSSMRRFKMLSQVSFLPPLPKLQFMHLP